jgi:hypothetical protein
MLKEGIYSPNHPHIVIKEKWGNSFDSGYAGTPTVSVHYTTEPSQSVSKGDCFDGSDEQ